MASPRTRLQQRRSSTRWCRWLLLLFLDLGRQRRDVGVRQRDPLRRLAVVEGLRKGYVASHGPVARAERPRSLDELEPCPGVVIELDSHRMPEQAGEHVAVDERPKVAEHRL